MGLHTFTKHLKNKDMKNKKVIIIATTSVIVLGILYFAFKKANEKNIQNDPKLKAEFDDLIKRIDKAKK